MRNKDLEIPARVDALGQCEAWRTLIDPNLIRFNASTDEVIPPGSRRINLDKKLFIYIHIDGHLESIRPVVGFDSFTIDSILVPSATVMVVEPFHLCWALLQDRSTPFVF